MKTTQFDAKTGKTFTAEITGESYAQRILGDGYFVIVNPDSKHVSFSKSHHDICFGDIVSDIIPDYTNQQYANDYGSKVISYDVQKDASKLWKCDIDRGGAENGFVSKTVREYMIENCRMNID